MNNKTFNEDICYNKMKDISQKKKNNEKYNTVNHSPTNVLNKKIFFIFKYSFNECCFLS